MTQLLNEFNQDKINKIVDEFERDANRLDLSHAYQVDANWIKAAVMHIDHLRQNTSHWSRMQMIARNTASGLMIKRLASGNWADIPYLFFLFIINSFEPSVQMRQIQRQHEKSNDESEPQLQLKPVIIQDDDHFLVMRAETPAAAIEARQRIEQATKQTYTWCISSSSNNMFYRYRTENKTNPITAYFVWDKTKPIDDAWHAFVLHISRNTMMFTNADNRSPETIAAHATSQRLQGIDASKLIVQPLTNRERSSIAGHASTTSFMYRSYDDRTNHIMQRNKLSMLDYAMIDKKQQHLYVHYLNPTKPTNMADAMHNIDVVFEPVLHAPSNGLYMISQASENSIAALFAYNEPYKEFLKYTWSKETKEYYYMIAQRTINNAVELIQKTYI
jgi:hypothetical protein